MRLKIKQYLLLLVLVLAVTACAGQPTPAAAVQPEAITAAIPTQTTEPEKIPPTNTAPTPQVPDRTLSEPAGDIEPVKDLINDFYTWYFAQPRGSVLTNRTYQDSLYLSGILKSDVSYMLDEMNKNGTGYDPFTCAQNDLPNLTIDQIFLSGGQATALMEVIQDGRVRHNFVVMLGTSEGSWTIEGISCPRDPKTTATAFLTWYLGYIYNGANAETGMPEIRNPIVEGALKDHFLLSDSMIQTIEDEKNSGADPILRAQSVPYLFDVQDGPTTQSATVRLQFGPQSARYYNYYMVEDPMGWKINEIEAIEVPVFNPMAHPNTDVSSWKKYADPEHGFSFQYPPDWSPRASKQTGLPADDPVRAVVFFENPAYDPNIPMIFLNIFEGSDGQLMQYYLTESHQNIKINGRPVWVDREGCSARYIFQHPQNEKVWLVIGDSCPSMDGRERYAQALDEVIAPLLRSVTFQ